MIKPIAIIVGAAVIGLVAYLLLKKDKGWGECGVQQALRMF